MTSDRKTTPRGTGVRGLLGRLRRDMRGNVFMLFGFAVIPLTVATGMGIDYGRAMRLQTKLQAAADAAALAAVTQYMMNSDDDPKDVAKRMFMSQAQGLNGLTLDFNDPSALNVTIQEKGTSILTRTAVVTFRGQSSNSFSKVLGINTLTVKGSSTSTNSVAPNIDFYMLLDTSGSMALPTTTDGLAKMQATNPEQCAFACHNTNYSPKATNKDGSTATDYYAAARSWGIPLRVDEEGIATQNLMTTAKQMMKTNHTTYRMSISTFAEAGTFSNIQSLTTNLAAAGTKAATAQVSLYYSNNCPTSSRCNNDTDTGTTDAFTKINTLMPNPGNGSNKSGDKPQEIMFIVTDGMRDEARPGGQPEVAIDSGQCTTIKNRGVRIAILYTEYLPATIANNSWSTDPSQGNVYGRLDQIEPALQDCASPGLYYKVSTDDDISAALDSLFEQAVSTARLTE